MAALTGQTVASTYRDLIHTNNGGVGLSASLSALYDGNGTMSPLKISTTQVGVDNLLFDANTVSTTSGNLTISSAGGTTVFSDAAFTISNQSAFQSALGLSVGSTVQAWSAKLDSLAAQTWAADTISYQTSTSALSTTALTSTARSLLDDTSTSVMRSTLGVAIGTDVQAYSDRLADVSAVGVTDNAVLIGNGANLVLESGATLKTSLGLTIGTNIQAYDVELSAIAGLTSAANKGITFTGAGTAATYDLTAAALTVLDDTTVSAMVDTLGGASATGSGGLVRATSPNFTTPLLGTPISGTLTNCTGYTGANLVLTDVTTNDASTSNHGFLKKLSNASTEFMNGAGNWAVPAGSVSSVATAGLATGGTITTTGTITVTAATSANQITGTSTTVAVVPGVQVNHPSATKIWALFGASAGGINSAYRVTSVTKNSTGNFTINFSVTLGSGNYATIVQPTSTNAGTALIASVAANTQSTTAVNIIIYNVAGVATDGANISIAIFDAS